MKLTCTINWQRVEEYLPDDGETVMIFIPGTAEPLLLGYWDNGEAGWKDPMGFDMLDVRWWAALTDVACPEEKQ